MINGVKISVIMGSFNPKSRDYFFNSVNSIIKQDFESWELIIYDDGSDKMYSDLMIEAQTIDRRIFYVKGEKRCGLAHVLNACIALSSGIYIARMDDDDVSEKDRLRKQCEFLDKNYEYAWVGSCAWLIDESGIWGLERVPEKPKKKDFLFNSPFIHPSVMFRKEVLTRNQGYNTDVSTLHCEDYELFMRLYSKGYRGYNFSEPLINYREEFKSYKKRTFKRRCREMRTRYKGFKEMGILNIWSFLYVVKPLFIATLPKFLLYHIKRYKNKILKLYLL